MSVRRVRREHVVVVQRVEPVLRLLVVVRRRARRRQHRVAADGRAAPDRRQVRRHRDQELQQPRIVADALPVLDVAQHAHEVVVVQLLLEPAGDLPARDVLARRVPVLGERQRELRPRRRLGLAETVGTHRGGRALRSVRDRRATDRRPASARLRRRPSAASGRAAGDRGRASAARRRRRRARRSAASRGGGSSPARSGRRTDGGRSRLRARSCRATTSRTSRRARRSALRAPRSASCARRS